MRWLLLDVMDAMEDMILTVVLTCAECCQSAATTLFSFLRRRLILTPPSDSKEP